MSAAPFVGAWELNDLVYCELKLGLESQLGDLRSPARDKGRELRAAVGNALTERAQHLDSIEDAIRHHEQKGSLKLSRPLFRSPKLGLEGRPELILWEEELRVYSLTRTPRPRIPSPRFNVFVFESEGVQAVAYGLLAAECLRVTPRTFVVNTDEALDHMVISKEAEPRDVRAALAAQKPIEVPFSASLQDYTASLIAQARAVKTAPAQARRSHNLPARCRSCTYQAHCPQRLA